MQMRCNHKIFSMSEIPRDVWCKPAALAIQPDYTKEECVAAVETGSEAHPRTGL